jgi:glycosyltransferase involved in cell wall biosynthesis
VFKNKRVEVIPNGINLQAFAPLDKAQARRELGLPADKKIIVFGATKSTGDPRKGFHLLSAALQKLAAQGWAQNAMLVVFGADGAEGRHESGFAVKYLGTLKTEAELVRAYSAGDVFVAPSIEENFANTILEALACGTPCAAFVTGGNPDLILHQANGYLVKPFEPEDLAAGMAWVLADGTRAGLRRQAFANGVSVLAIFAQFQNSAAQMSRVKRVIGG